MTPPTPSASPLAWRDEYSINVAELDAQHRNLLDLLNKVNAHAAKPASPAHHAGPLMTLLEELNEYAYYHFTTEESLMRQHLANSEGTARHLAAHRSYWTIIADFKKRLEQKDSTVGAELLEYLNRWWVRHILETDRHMGVELNQLGIR